MGDFLRLSIYYLSREPYVSLPLAAAKLAGPLANIMVLCLTPAALGTGLPIGEDGLPSGDYAILFINSGVVVPFCCGSLT